MLHIPNQIIAIEKMLTFCSQKLNPYNNLHLPYGITIITLEKQFETFILTGVL
jgi:hypothetical protein